MYLKKAGQRPEEIQTAIHGFMLIIEISLWMVGFILILSNSGVQVTSLVAGLGIGGIAVALAAQNILGDIFSSFSIYFDKPFSIGDFIVVGDQNGVVKRIGLKTTRIQTLQGEELILPNRELANARVQNFKRMERRRVVFKLGIVYESTVVQVERVPVLIREIIEKIDNTGIERIHFSNLVISV